MSFDREVADLIDALGLDGSEAVAQAALSVVSEYPALGALVATALDLEGHHLLAMQVEQFAASAAQTQEAP